MICGSPCAVATQSGERPLEEWQMEIFRILRLVDSPVGMSVTSAGKKLASRMIHRRPPWVWGRALKHLGC